MLYLDRLCIPIGLACDLDCKYCYRQAGKRTVPRLTEHMIEYIKSLTPEKTYVVVASGGEPLLYWKRVVELFSYVPKGIYKKVMTNGTHLTQEIVDYINENEVELHFSHDGPISAWTRGVDVLEDPKILDLVKQVKNLRVHAVIVKGNEDIIAVKKYLQEKLGRTDFYFTCSTIWGNVFKDELTDGFNYDLFAKTWVEYKSERQYWDRYRVTRPGAKSLGLNVLPDGTVVAVSDMTVYGTIDDDIETIKQRLNDTRYNYACDKMDCPIKSMCVCGNALNMSTEHFCKTMMQTLSNTHFLKHQGVDDATCL